MLEKMNEPAGPGFALTLFGIVGLLSLALLTLFAFAKVEERQIKETRWYKDCAEQVLPANAVPTLNTYQVTQICWQTARAGGPRANKYLAAATALSTPKQTAAIHAHLEKVRETINCGKRRCRITETAG